MKRLITVILITGILLIVVALFSKPIVVSIVKNEMGKVFVQSRVAIDNCRLGPARRLGLVGLRIKREGAYTIEAKEIIIEHEFIPEFPWNRLSLTIINPSVSVNTPKKTIGECADFLQVRPGGPPLFGSIGIEGLSLKVDTRDLAGKLAGFSLRLNFGQQGADYFNVRLQSLSLQGVQLENASFESLGGSGSGSFAVERLKYDKLLISDIKGKTQFLPAEVALTDISARALEGDLTADADLKIGVNPQYRLALKCARLNINTFVRDFNLQDKFTMTGYLSGDVELAGTGNLIETLGGTLSTLQPGGTLVITDTKFLENIASSTNQPRDLLVESFKNYRYNTGLARLGVEEGAIVLKVALEGLEGKRNFNVILHDLVLGGKKK